MSKDGIHRSSFNEEDFCEMAFHSSGYFSDLKDFLDTIDQGQGTDLSHSWKGGEGFSLNVCLYF